MDGLTGAASGGYRRYRAYACYKIYQSRTPLLLSLFSVFFAIVYVARAV